MQTPHAPDVFAHCGSGCCRDEVLTSLSECCEAMTEGTVWVLDHLDHLERRTALSQADVQPHRSD